MTQPQARQVRGGRWVLLLAAATLLLFLALPLVSLLWRAATEPAGVAAVAGRSLLSAIGVSLGTTAISALLIVAGGTPLAFFLARSSFRGKQLLGGTIQEPVDMTGEGFSVD